MADIETLIPTDPSEKKPVPPRRPRVKQVSSRFMSPAVSSSGDPHRSLSAQRRSAWISEEEPLSENRPDLARSSETPFPSGFHAKIASQRRPAAARLYKENGDQNVEFSRLPESTLKTLNSKCPRARSRIDTPVIKNFPTATPRSNFANQSNSRSISSFANSAAAKLVQSNILTAQRREIQESGSLDRRNPEEEETGSETSSICDNFALVDFAESEIPCQPGNCGSPPISSHTVKSRSNSELWSSMPEANLTGRLLAGEANARSDLCRVSASSCYRSLSSSLSNCQQPFNSTRPVIRSSKNSSICLPPPHPSQVKSNTETKRGRNVTSNAEDVHSLRLLQNRYLQWRFANAKAEVTMNNKKIASERLLSTAVTNVSNMWDSVSNRRMELAQLKLVQRLYTILDAQIPYLNEWDTLEEDYSGSLTGLIKALQDAAVRLPTTGIVRADIRDLSEAFDSATNALEVISPHVESFQSRAAEVHDAISDLAEVVSRERSLIEECGDLLTKANVMQVEECSLRTQLIQMKMIQ